MQLAPEILDHIADSKDGHEINCIHDFRKRKGVWEVQLLSYCNKSRESEWMTLKSVAKQAALLLRALPRQKGVRERDDLESFKAAMDKVIPKQTRRPKNGPHSALSPTGPLPVCAIETLSNGMGSGDSTTPKRMKRKTPPVARKPGRPKRNKTSK